MLVRTDVVVDPVLSNVSKAYSNEMYIADTLFPGLKVGKETGKYYIYDRAKFRRNITRRAAGAKANEVEYGLSTASFTTEDHALKEKTPWEILRQADSALNPELDATENITEQLLIDKEIGLATSMEDTAVISTNNTTLSGTSQWSDFTNSDPIGNVRAGMVLVQKQIGRKPNTLVLGKEVFDKLIDHPDIVERVKYSLGAAVTEELLARIFNVGRVIVAEAIKNTATEGANDSMDYIWGKHAWLIYVAPAARVRSITLGFTFKYEDRKVKKWDDEDAEARFIRVNENYVHKFVAEEAAHLIKNAIA